MPPSRTGSRNCVNPSSLLNLVPPHACMPAGDLRCIAWHMCRRARARVHACWLALCVMYSYEEKPESKKGPTAPALTDLWSVGAAEQPAAARQSGARRCCSLMVSLTGPRGDAKALAPSRVSLCLPSTCRRMTAIPPHTGMKLCTIRRNSTATPQAQTRRDPHGGQNRRARLKTCMRCAIWQTR